MTTALTIRDAKIEDAGLILYFVKELAKFVKAPHKVTATVEDYETTIFSQNTTTHALICEKAGQPVGFAVYFFNYSTWQGKSGIYLEDLYILSEFRKLGAGKALFHNLAKIALDNNCGRLDWTALDWNQPAIDFYLSCGAKSLKESVQYRLEGSALEDFARS
ncbi:MAG: GNAT family N-acetyltransferase [Desulfobacteraceae bacterium]|nr:GNAT family N-acetyltransferase [Desulfobacteraceae bacterium]